MSGWTEARAATSQGMVWDIARALHAGHSWGELARAVGAPPRRFKALYRPKVRSRILRLLGEDGHGTLARYIQGPCYPDGRRCDPCTAAKAEHLARSRNTAPVRTDPTFLGQLARRLVDGESWEAIAVSLGRSRTHVQGQVRELVQPFCLALVDAEQPSATHRAHGTYVKFVQDECRCEPCCWANTRYERERQLRRRRGQQELVDAGQVRQRLQELREDGLGLRRVAALSGVAESTLGKIVYGEGGRPPSRRVRVETVTAVMAVRASLDDLADGARVDATVTWRRIEHLRELGATNAWISEQIGQGGRALQLSRSTVTARNARAIRDLHVAVTEGRLAPRGRRSRWTPEPASAPAATVHPIPARAGTRLPDGWARRAS